jgi:hypothetical protein
MLIQGRLHHTKVKEFRIKSIGRMKIKKIIASKEDNIQHPGIQAPHTVYGPPQYVYIIVGPS